MCMQKSGWEFIGFPLVYVFSFCIGVVLIVMAITRSDITRRISLHICFYPRLLELFRL